MKKTDVNNNDKIYKIIPIILIIGLIPLIVRLKVIKLNDIEINAWTGQQYNYDFFSYYKMIFIIILTIILISIFLYNIINKKIVFKKYNIYIPMYIYSIFVILSVLLSKYKKTSIFGFPDRYEGALLLIAYIIITYITINIIDNKKYIKYIIYSLIISCFIITIIGLLQYLYIDIYKINFFKFFILPPSLKNAKIKFMFDGTNTIYSTLYHYNYVGSYMALVFPIIFILFLYVKDKKNKIVLAILSLLTLFNLIGSTSRAGFVGLIMSIIFSTIFFRKDIKRNIGKISIFILIILVVIYGINLSTGNKFGKRILTIFEGINENQSSAFTLKDINIENNIATIQTSNETLKLYITEEGDLEFKDEDDKIIDILYNNGQVIFKDKRYSDYSAKVFLNPTLKVPEINVIKNNLCIYFVVKDNQICFYDPKGKGNIVELKKVEKIGFEGIEKIGSARGYIWSRSIPLLKNTLIVGYGPDTFAYVFPQYDYVGKFNAYGTISMAVDKPHNLYLNVALSTGIISLIAFLSIIFMYFKDCFKNFFNCNFDEEYQIYGIGIFIGIVGYLTTGFFNDSVVSVAPVFWVLLGIGISINIKLNQKNRLKN